MKKSNLLFVLSAFMLAGCATNGSQSASTEPSVPSTSTSTSAEPVIEKHAVSVPTSVAGAYVTASRSEAVAGDQVDVTVALTDPTNYELKSVKVGEQVLEGTVDANNSHVFHYSFVMGDADASVEVVTEQIVAPTKDHTIAFEGKDLVFALDMPQDANVGEHVSFKLAAQSGYEISSVKVVKVSAAAPAEEGEDASEPTEEEVTLTGNAVLGYSFDMPDADVVIKAEALGAYFKVNADTEKVVFEAKGTTSSSGKLVTNDFIGFYLDNKDEKTNTNFGYFRAGSEVRVVAKRSAFTDKVKYFANGVEMEAVEDETYLMYKFTMPATNTEITITAEDKYIDIEVVNSAHVTSSLYSKETVDGVETKTPVTRGLPGETLYMDLTCTDVAGYKLDKPTSSMLKFVAPNSLSTTEYVETRLEAQSGATDAAATYSIIVPSVVISAGKLTINAKEKELIYAGKSFIGTYYGYELYGSKVFFSSIKTLVVGADGELTNAVKDTITASNEDAKSFTLKTRGEAHYDEETGALWFYYDSGKKATDLFLFSNKIVDSTKVKTVYYYPNNDFVLGQMFETVDGADVLRASIFINKNANNIVLSPTIEMISGSRIDEKDAKFIVKDGSTVLGVVGVGGEYGTYKNGDSTLVLNGEGVATLDGVEGTYVVDSTNKLKITVTVSEVEHVYTIDKDAKTFADFVEEAKSLYSSFKSTTNNNTLTLNSDGTGVYNGTSMTFTFVESTNKVTFTVNGLTFDLTWDATAGTLIGTFDDGDYGPTDITFNIVAEEVPFYVGTFTGKVFHDSESLNSQCTLVINPDKKTGTYVHNGDTRTFTIGTIGVDTAGNTKIMATDASGRELTITCIESKNQVDFNYTTSASSWHYYTGTLTKQA